MKCPTCHCANPSTQHLIKEYQSLLKAGFNDVLGRAARKSCNEIVDILHSQGITTIPNIFGPIEIKKWTY